VTGHKPPKTEPHKSLMIKYCDTTTTIPPGNIYRRRKTAIELKLMPRGYNSLVCKLKQELAITNSDTMALFNSPFVHRRLTVDLLGVEYFSISFFRITSKLECGPMPNVMVTPSAKVP